MKKILVITNEADHLLSALFQKYLSKNDNFIIFNIDLIQKNLLTISQGFFELNGLKITIKSIDLIWYRRLDFLESSMILKNLIHLEKVPIDEALFMYSEYKQLLLGLLHLLKDTPTINHIDIFYNSNYKISNFERAKEIGFNVPSSIISNDICKIEEFGNKYLWNVVLKTFFTTTYKKDSIEYYVPVKKISRDDFNHSKNLIRSFPIYLQQYIEKQYELRIVVIGKEIFPFAIYSQEHESSKIDFRIDDLSKLKHELIEIPEYLTNFIVQYISDYQIDFCSFDIVFTPNNEYYFLECNLDGEWYWIEDITGVKLTDRIWSLINSKL